MEISTKFKAYGLSKSCSENQMTLYMRFQRIEPKIEPLLDQAGLIKKEG